MLMTQHRKLGAGAVGLALVLALVPAANAAEAHKLLPEDTGAVITVNVRQILDSNLVKKHALDLIKQGIQDQEEVQKVMKALGLDPLKDVDQVVIAAPDLSENNKGLVIVSGRFDPAKIKATAADAAKKQADQFKLHQVGAHQVYEIKVPDQPEPMFAAVADAKTLVAAPTKEYVADALDKANGKKAGGLKNKEMAALLQQADGRQSAWMVMGGSALEKGLPAGVDDNVKAFLKKLDMVAGGLTVTDDVKMQVVLGAKDPQAAKDLHKVVTEGINQGVGVLALLAGQQKELAPLVDVVKGIRTTSKDKAVTINATVPADLIEKALKMGQ
jgi:hypothetical protein